MKNYVRKQARVQAMLVTENTVNELLELVKTKEGMTIVTAGEDPALLENQMVITNPDGSRLLVEKDEYVYTIDGLNFISQPKTLFEIMFEENL